MGELLQPLGRLGNSLPEAGLTPPDAGLGSSDAGLGGPVDVGLGPSDAGLGPSLLELELALQPEVADALRVLDDLETADLDLGTADLGTAELATGDLGTADLGTTDLTAAATVDAADLSSATLDAADDDAALDAADVDVVESDSSSRGGDSSGGDVSGGDGGDFDDFDDAFGGYAFEAPFAPSLVAPRPPQPAVCFPADVLQGVVALASTLATARGVRLEAQLNSDVPGVRAGEQPLREALTNLVDNALKYCSADGDTCDSTAGGALCGGEPLLCVSCRADEARRLVVIEIWNSCAPLDEAGEALLEWGARGSAAVLGGIEGSGYGLPIVQQLVSLMGGDVRLQNAPMPCWAWERCVLSGDGSDDSGEGEGGEDGDAAGGQNREVDDGEGGSMDGGAGRLVAFDDDDGVDVEGLPGGVSAVIELPRA